MRKVIIFQVLIFYIFSKNSSPPLMSETKYFMIKVK